MNTVYLAGPISGLSYDAATDWRKKATFWLERAGIKALSPMRAKTYLAGTECFDEKAVDYGKFSPLSTNKGVMTRDRFDATRCDVMLVNMLDQPKPSVGTIMEIAWADLCRTPVVCVLAADDPLRHHPMFVEACGFIVETVDEAIELVKAILS